MSLETLIQFLGLLALIVGIPAWVITIYQYFKSSQQRKN